MLEAQYSGWSQSDLQHRLLDLPPPSDPQTGVVAGRPTSTDRKGSTAGTRAGVPDGAKRLRSEAPIISGTPDRTAEAATITDQFGVSGIAKWRRKGAGCGDNSRIGN